MIKGMLRQMVTEQWSGTWIDRLPFIRMALHAMVHSSTGMTPFKLWMSRATDPVLPSDLMYDTLRNKKVPSCPQEYIAEQQRMMQRIFEIVRQQSGKAVARQKKAHAQKGLRERILCPGDWVWRHWPPGQVKTSGAPYSGPYKVLDVTKDGSLFIAMPPEYI